MSAFLGPIHARMYGKVQAVNALADTIAAFSDAQCWTSTLLTDLREHTMSAFLGPIHARMYGKVQAVNALADTIAAFSDAQCWTSTLLTDLRASLPAPSGTLEQVIDLSQIHASLSGLVDQAERRLAFAVTHAIASDAAHILPAPSGTLEQVIDLSQIHASLSGLVDQAERRLAFAVTHAIASDAAHIRDLCTLMENQGAQAAPQTTESCVAAWQTMDTYWLDGMPCDGGDAAHIRDLCTLMENQGAQAAPQTTESCVAAWQTMDTYWLDGMPCDGGVQFLQTEPDEVVWSVHGQHPAPDYWTLRIHWMQGFCTKLHLRVHRLHRKQPNPVSPRGRPWTRTGWTVCRATAACSSYRPNRTKSSGV